MRLGVRAIPPAVAIAFGLVACSPLVSGWPGDEQTNKATLFAIAGMFAFKAALFWWMRQRMHDGVRTLTRFGATLVDFFTAVVSCDLALVVVFGVAYAYARLGDVAPFWLRLSERAALIAGVAFVISTGGAVALEMRRAGDRLRVHEGEP